MKTLIRFYHVIRSWFLPIYSVTAYDFNNADPVLLGHFEDEDGWNTFFEIKDSFLTNGHDGVMFLMFRQSGKSGWLTALDSNGKESEFVYWTRTNFIEAYHQAWEEAKRMSKNLGFRERKAA